MKFSSLTERTAGDSVDAWEVHYEGVARKEAGEDIIVLSVGEEIEEVTPAGIVDAAVDSLRNGRHHYTSVNGNSDLRRAVVKRHFERTGREVGGPTARSLPGRRMRCLRLLSACWKRVMR